MKSEQTISPNLNLVGPKFKVTKDKSNIGASSILHQMSLPSPYLSRREQFKQNPKWLTTDTVFSTKCFYSQEGLYY